MLADRSVGVARMKRRVLITGLSTLLGRPARAGARAATRAVEAIIGVATEDPTLALERTEFVRVGTQHALLRRIVARRARSTPSSTRA